MSSTGASEGGRTEAWVQRGGVVVEREDVVLINVKMLNIVYSAFSCYHIGSTDSRGSIGCSGNLGAAKLCRLSSDGWLVVVVMNGNRSDRGGGRTLVRLSRGTGVVVEIAIIEVFVVKNMNVVKRSYWVGVSGCHWRGRWRRRCIV